MEDCPHVRQVQLASDKSFLNPRHWACADCGTTESVWACLLCSNVACGRDATGHALRHFTLTKHPLAVEVNQRYVHCYHCDDYILNDNSSGDISLLQSLLEQVASQSYVESHTRSGRVMKPATQVLTRSQSRMDLVSDSAADRRYTALCHWRYLLLFRAFNTWKANVREAKQSQSAATTTKEETTRPATLKRRRLLTPGMTGLRNLGNTCYMNAVLQSLGHVLFFREFFRQLLPQQAPPPAPPTTSSRRRAQIQFNRQTTIECYTHISTRPSQRPHLPRRCVPATGLSGGGEGGRKRRRGRSPEPSSQDESNTSLCEELHRLMRVMWSGKWAVVTPHTVLNAIWQLIPSFHGYTQQDAQEFLCELLDRLQSELEQWQGGGAQPLRLPSSSEAPPLSSGIHHEVLPTLFQGQLVSTVCYKSCQHCSRVYEPFWDLSLEFPETYQVEPSRRNSRTGISTAPCTLEEQLAYFTREEWLEGSVYRCEQATSCRGHTQPASRTLHISQHPDVLRLHLKRFRWSGRSRHKISTHVSFPLTLDLSPHTPAPPPDDGIVTMETSSPITYELSSVVMHHGSGFQSGHYTAYCWNTEAGSWVHCNDARTVRCSRDEVLCAQAYILFYILRRRGVCGLLLGDGEEPDAKRRKLK